VPDRRVLPWTPDDSTAEATGAPSTATASSSGTPDSWGGADEEIAAVAESGASGGGIWPLVGRSWRAGGTRSLSGCGRRRRGDGTRTDGRGGGGGRVSGLGAPTRVMLPRPWSGVPATTVPLTAARPVVMVTGIVTVEPPIVNVRGRFRMVTSPVESMAAWN